MYPMTRESVMAVISSSVAEKAVCWCEGRKKRSRRIVCRIKHPGVGGTLIVERNRERHLALVEMRTARGGGARSTRTQTRTSATYLKSKDLPVDLRFTSSALSSRRRSRLVPPVRRQIWLVHWRILRNRSIPRLWPRHDAPAFAKRRGFTEVFWPLLRNGPSSGWLSTCLSGSIPTT